MSSSSSPSPVVRVQMPCRLCGGPSKPAFEVGDLNRELGPGSFEYRRCLRCRAVFMTEIPEDLARYYAANGYGSAEDELTPELRRREQDKLEMLARFIRPGRMVEIGPGPGLFTRAAEAAGFEITAIEMDRRYCESLERVLGIRAIQSDAPEKVLSALPLSRAVVMWHVIEHLPNPWEVLDQCVQNLEPGGVLAISTPNPESLQFRLLGARWMHVDAPRHLQLIPSRTLDDQLRKRGLVRVFTTTSDQVGRALSRMGWGNAVVGRRDPEAISLTRTRAAIAVTLTLGAFERCGLPGAAYTSIFIRRGQTETGDET
jgi:2-polyprenyl-3-methyl-5-hydroxy-6-metoxy-1,4-benzoquinol methylase